MTGPAGMAVGTDLLCPARRRHIMASVYRNLDDGALFVRGWVLSGDTPRRVRCPTCGRTYLVDPAAVRRAVREGHAKYKLPRTRALPR
jgi:hypothetical protein